VVSGSAWRGRARSAGQVQARGARVERGQGASAWRQREEEGEEMSGWAPRAIERKRGGGGRLAGWAPNGPNSARVRVFRIFFFSFLFYS
jgi:hypothetical protein